MRRPSWPSWIGPGGRSVADPLEDRRRERQRLIGLAREHVERFARRRPVTAAAVVGSVARGDFNVWSDVDVVIVVEGLPERAPERGRLLAIDAPPRVQAVGFTPEEFRAALAAGNPLAREAVERGVALAGESFLQAAGRATS